MVTAREKALVALLLHGVLAIPASIALILRDDVEDEVLIALLDSRDRDEVRAAAEKLVEALGKYGPAARSAIDHLGKLTSNPALTHHASVALARLGAEESS